MRIVIFGPGAVGGYFGGRLAAAARGDRGGLGGIERVAFVARGGALDTLRTAGLRITSPLGDLHLEHVDAADSADTEALGPADVVILAVKAWQVPEAARSIRGFLADDGFVLPLQNGVDAPDELAEVLGAERVVGGLCKILAKLEAPGHVRHFGAEPFVALGELDDRASERIRALRAALEAAGIRVGVPPSIRAALWEKLLLIASTSSLGAVTRMPMGTVRRATETRELLEQAMTEVRDVALAQNLPVRPDIVERTLAFVDDLPEAGTTSMQRDVMDGKPSELEAQIGAVVRHGLRVGVPTPVHDFVHRVLLPSERAARGEETPPDSA